MPFRFLEHTADARIECTGRDFAELLESAAEGLYGVALRTRRTDADVESAVHAAGADREEVLVRWLQELLFLLDTEHFVAARFHFESASGCDVRARVFGYACTADERAEEVKSATYQQVRVREMEQGLLAQFTLDL
jgi:SHS2 domain-containing protein